MLLLMLILLHPYHALDFTANTLDIYHRNQTSSVLLAFANGTQTHCLLLSANHSLEVQSNSCYMLGSNDGQDASYKLIDKCQKSAVVWPQ